MLEKEQLIDIYHDNWKKNVLSIASNYQSALTLVSNKKDLDYLLSNGANIISHEGACLAKIMIENNLDLFSYLVSKGGISFIDNYYKYTGYQLFNNISSKHKKIHDVFLKLNIDFSQYNSFKSTKMINSLLFDLPKNPKNTFYLLSHPKCFSCNKRQKNKIIFSMLDFIITTRKSNALIGKVWIDIFNLMLNHLDAKNKKQFILKLSSSPLRGFDIDDFKVVKSLNLKIKNNTPTPTLLIEQLLKKSSISSSQMKTFLSTKPKIDDNLSILFLHCTSFALKGACKLLLEYGINPNASLSSPHPLKGCSAIYISSLYGYTSITQLLLSHGADPNSIVDLDGLPPLTHATMNSDEKSVNILLKHGADPNLLDKTNRSALFYLPLVNKSCLNIANALLKAGADPNAVDKDNKDIVSFLSEKSKEQFVYGLFDKSILFKSMQEMLGVYKINQNKNHLIDNVGKTSNKKIKKERKI